ncbi:hypothetical protein GGF31_007711 [Allomyces arbusculus]|nr:hypothetical protein GGF31_007711 [Allomyces arbusculus]
MDAHHHLITDPTTTDDVVALLNARKRRRRTLAKERHILEDAFAQCATPDRAERARLAREIGWSDKAVTVWFQNRRQKERKYAATSTTSTTTPITMRPPSPAPSTTAFSSPSRSRTASLASSTCASPPTPTTTLPALSSNTPPLSPTPAARLSSQPWSIPTPVPVRVPPVATALRSLIRARAAMQAPRPAVVEHAVDPACPCYACSRALLLGMPAPVEVEAVDRSCQAFAPLATLLAVCEVERERERVVQRPATAAAAACSA